MTEVGHALDNDTAAAAEAVDLRPSRAISDVQAFLPGVSASLLAFIVFGTTKAFRDFFYHKLVPRHLRRRIANRVSKAPSLVRNGRAAEPGPPAMYPRSPGIPITLGSECFELEGGEAGLGSSGSRQQGAAHELAIPTPTYGAFPQGQKGPDLIVLEDDRWPILDSKR